DLRAAADPRLGVLVDNTDVYTHAHTRGRAAKCECPGYADEVGAIGSADTHTLTVTLADRIQVDMGVFTNLRNGRLVQLADRGRACQRAIVRSRTADGHGENFLKRDGDRGHAGNGFCGDITCGVFLPGGSVNSA